MTNIQQLQQKRADLLAEQEELTTLEPQLEAAWKAMPSYYNHLGHKIGTPEQTAAMDEASKADSRL